ARVAGIAGRANAASRPSQAIQSRGDRAITGWGSTGGRLASGGRKPTVLRGGAAVLFLDAGREQLGAQLEVRDAVAVPGLDDARRGGVEPGNLGQPDDAGL